MRFLVVSPHLDDAVLSYGGRLADLTHAGHEVLAYTVFAGSPAPPYSALATELHEAWCVDGDPVRARREEDRRALRELGVAPRHGEHLDAAYRRNADGGWLLDGVDALHYRGSPEPELVAGIAAAVEGLVVEYRPSRVLTCAAVGGHVDHLRARDATATAAVRTGAPLTFWEDFPYALLTEAVPSLAPGLALSQPVAEAVSPAAWEAKNRAVECYKSQLPTLQFGPDDIFAALARHSARRHGERVWQVRRG